MCPVLLAEGAPPVLQQRQILVANQQHLLEKLGQPLLLLGEIHVAHLGELVQHLHLAGRGVRSISVYIYTSKRS